MAAYAADACQSSSGRRRHGPRARRPDETGDLRRSLRFLRLGPDAIEPLLRAHREFAGLAAHHQQAPPNLPPSAADYTRYGLPWFDYYDDSLHAVEGSGILGKLKSVLGIAKQKRETPLPENEACDPQQVVKIKANAKATRCARARSEIPCGGLRNWQRLAHLLAELFSGLGKPIFQHLLYLAAEFVLQGERQRRTKQGYRLRKLFRMSETGCRADIVDRGFQILFLRLQ